MPIERFFSAIPWEAAVGYSRAVRAGPFVLDSLEDALAQAGARLEQVVQTRIYVVDIARADEIGRAHGERFADIRPVSTMVQVAALIDPRMLVEIEAMAYVGA